MPPTFVRINEKKLVQRMMQLLFKKHRILYIENWYKIFCLGFGIIFRTKIPVHKLATTNSGDKSYLQRQMFFKNGTVYFLVPKI